MLPGFPALIVTMAVVVSYWGYHFHTCPSLIESWATKNGFMASTTSGLTESPDCPSASIIEPDGRERRSRRAARHGFNKCREETEAQWPNDGICHSPDWTK